MPWLDPLKDSASRALFGSGRAYRLNSGVTPLTRIGLVVPAPDQCLEVGFGPSRPGYLPALDFAACSSAESLRCSVSAALLRDS